MADGPIPSGVPLRGREKAHTRQVLAEAALRLFTERGFDATTLDDVVAAVAISKPMFFRTFTSKEDVALAPEKELWSGYVREIEACPLSGPVLAVYQEALEVTLAGMDSGWERRFAVSRRLADATPSLTAHSLQHCAEITRTVVEIVVARLGPDVPERVQLHLPLELMVAAWRWALKEWAEGGFDPGRAALQDRMGEAFSAIPLGMALTLSLV
ncbi:TetR/AcrR family transcriptional regulator [Sphaerisporangium corydalis]|uniref:TetR/AcrR family transcriptional regulator n=1 Tax=Sphaerisporangium corydalis TaxID=1441875 RepID=A0ABV9EDA6_9ACTN|nr:TetR/AcrR family transcriptional regulator [Sphaerisporangium corydalis]